MLGWLKKVRHTGDADEVDPVLERASADRLGRILAEHKRRLEEPPPPKPATPPLLLPAPNYRREFIGRF